MKEQKPFRSLILCLILITAFGCAQNSHLDLSQSPKVTPKVTFNDLGEATIEATPTDSTIWNNPDLEALEEKIRQRRAKRNEERRKALKDESLVFSDITATFKSDDTKEINLNVTYRDQIKPLVFISPKDHGQHFIFSRKSGFGEKIISLEGLCLEEDEACPKLALKISYVVGKIKYVQRFTVANPNYIEEPAKVSTKEEEPAKDHNTVKSSENSEEDLKADTVVEKPETPQLADESVSIKKETPETTRKPKVEEEDSSNNDKEQEEEKNSTEEKTKDPNAEKEVVALKETPEIEHKDPSLVTGAVGIVFPKIADDKSEDLKVFDFDKGEVSKEDVISNTSDELLKRIQTHVYNQSKRFYSKHKNRHGKIIDSDQLSHKLRGAVVHKHRRNNQFGSGILVDTLTYASRKFSTFHPGVPICINDLSLKKGGDISSHSSHENGLDADVSFPSTGNNCTGKTSFKTYSNLDRVDDSFRQKNWDFINILLSTKRVHGILTDPGMIRRLCRHAKKIRVPKKERAVVFKKLHPLKKGHKAHYHLRMTCNAQNAGCVEQGVLTGSTCH